MLECIALGRRYGRKTAVSDLNLMLDAGKIHVLLGENGSGKTTFLKMAAGLLRPSRGQILFQGHPLSWRDRAKISWLSTESVFYDYMRVSDVEQYYADFFPDFDRERFFILTQKLGLTDNPKVRNLSSGSGAMFLPELGISWIDLVQDAATAILLWLQIVMSGFFAVLLARTVLADSRHGGLLSFLLFWLINLACGLGYQAASGLSLLSGLPPAGWYAFDVIYYLGLDLLFFLLTVFLAGRKLSPQAV